MASVAARLSGCALAWPQPHIGRASAINLYAVGISAHSSLSLLLLGLFAEVAVYVIRMPDLNTVDFDPALIVISALLSFCGGIMMLRLSWLLWRDPVEAAVACH